MDVPVKYLAAVLFSPGFDLEQDLYPELEKLFGPLDSRSKDYRFDMTDYYSAEMGKGLQRRILSFSGLESAALLAEKKLACRRLEESFSRGQRRRVNIDPGYIDFFKLVLASFKEAPQKIYLGSSVFADMVLLYQDGEFRVLPWTFPDFREGIYMEYLHRVRELYRMEMRERRD
jgi:hypothetical protein